MYVCRVQRAESRERRAEDGGRRVETHVSCVGVVCVCTAQPKTAETRVCGEWRNEDKPSTPSRLDNRTE